MLVLTLLDREHLDNGPFLKSLALALTQIRDVRFLFIHSDSEYTDRVMQTGMMRHEARIRSTRELNHRLVALFNNEGVHCVGLNGYQMNCIVQSGVHPDHDHDPDHIPDPDIELDIDSAYLGQLLSHTHVILSNLISAPVPDGKTFADPALLAKSLTKVLKPSTFIVFSKSETAGTVFGDQNTDSQANTTGRYEFLRSQIPVEMAGSELEMMISNLRQFSALPDVSAMEKVSLKSD